MSPHLVADLLSKTRFAHAFLHNDDWPGQVGSLQPIKVIAELCRGRGIMCHTDAAQSIGKVPVKVRRFFLFFCRAPFGGYESVPAFLACDAERNLPASCSQKSHSTYPRIFVFPCQGERTYTHASLLPTKFIFTHHVRYMHVFSALPCRGEITRGQPAVGQREASTPCARSAAVLRASRV